MRLRDSIGRGTAITRVKMRDGFTCEVEDGRWNLTVDMSAIGRRGTNGSLERTTVLL